VDHATTRGVGISGVRVEMEEISTGKEWRVGIGKVAGSTGGDKGQSGATIGSVVGARRGWASPRSCVVYRGGAAVLDRGEKPS